MTVPCQGAEAPSAREGLCGANRVKSAEVPTNVKEVVARFAVVLFVDEAHALTRHTLTDLKRLLEVVEDGDGKLSIVLAGHPKLGND